MNTHFKQLIEEPFSGLKVILGNLSIHLVEGEPPVVKKLLRAVNANMLGPNPFYNQAWIVHFTDEV